jgi:hypothetical protein
MLSTQPAYLPWLSPDSTMNTSLLTAGLAALGSAVFWMVALGQLGQPHYPDTSIPDHSTRTEYPGP